MPPPTPLAPSPPPAPVRVAPEPRPAPPAFVQHFKHLPVVAPPDSEKPAPIAPVHHAAVKAEPVVKPAKKPSGLSQIHNHARTRLPGIARHVKLKYAAPVAGLILVGVGVFAVVNWSREPVRSNVLAAQTVEEAAAINSDEKPVILYVTDKNKVAQPFLDKAENGDEVRLYYQAKKAVLYRPSTYSVISIGDFTPPPAKVFLRSGNASASKVLQVERTIKDNEHMEFISKDKSASTTYAKTLVVDLTSRYPSDAKALAAELGGTMGALPRGELAPEADILVIVGSE